ncbi:MAG: CBS domain-containing protein [Actinomycetota bacterium]
MRDDQAIETDAIEDDFESFGSGPDGPGREMITSLLADEVVFVEPTASVHEAAEVLRSADVGLAVVGHREHVAGVVSERDIVRAVALGRDLDTTIVEVIETEDLRWSTTQTSIDDVAEEMLENHLRHVLVRNDDGSLAGVASMRDLLGAYLP